MFASMIGSAAKLDLSSPEGGQAAGGPQVGTAPNQVDGTPRDVIGRWMKGERGQPIPLGDTGAQKMHPIYEAPSSPRMILERSTATAEGNDHKMEKAITHMTQILEEVRSLEKSQIDRFMSMEASLLRDQARNTDKLHHIIETEIKGLRRGLLQSLGKVQSSDAPTSGPPMATRRFRPTMRSAPDLATAEVATRDSSRDSTPSVNIEVGDVSSDATNKFLNTSTTSYNVQSESSQAEGQKECQEAPAKQSPRALDAGSPSTKSRQRWSISNGDELVHNREEVAKLGVDRERSKMQAHLQRMSATEESTNTGSVLMKLFGLKQQQLKALTKKPKSRLTDFVEGKRFSLVCIVLILSNAAWIGFITNENMARTLADPSEPSEDWWKQVNRGFALCFLVELIIRAVALRSSFWTRPPDYKWNIYDAFLVVCSIVEEIVDTLNLNFLRALRVVRLVRVVRIIRVLRFFTGLRHMMCVILNSAWPLVWAVMVILFLIYMFSIFFMQMLQESLDDSDPFAKNLLRNHWGTVFEAMDALLQAIAGGIQWKELVDELLTISWIFRPIFHVYIVITVYGVINVINGVFVQKTAEMKVLDKDLAIHHEMNTTRQFVFELRGLLEENGFGDGDDMMNWEVFQSHMKAEDVQMYLQTHRIDVEEAEELFLMLDVEQEGAITIDSFVYGCQRLKGVAKGMDVVLLFEHVSVLRKKLQELADRMKHGHGSHHEGIGTLVKAIQDTREDLAQISYDQEKLHKAVEATLR